MSCGLWTSCATWSTATGCQCMPGTFIFRGESWPRPLSSIKMYGCGFRFCWRQAGWNGLWKSSGRMICGILFQCRKFPPVSACVSVWGFLIAVRSSFRTTCWLFLPCFSSFARMSLSDLPLTLFSCPGFRFTFWAFHFSFPRFCLSFPWSFLWPGKIIPDFLGFTSEIVSPCSSLPPPFSTSCSQSTAACHQSNTTNGVRSPSINSSNDWTPQSPYPSLSTYFRDA